jgi:hypothetical protein
MEREIADGAGGVAPPRSAALLQIDGAPVRFVA